MLDLFEMLQTIQNFDLLVNNFFVNLVSRFPFLFPVFLKITFFGSFLFIFYSSIVIFCIFAFLPGKYSLSYFTAITVSSSLTYFMKLFFERVGPSGRALLEIDYSFPSGHATLAVAFFGIIYYLFRKNVTGKYKKIIFFIFTHTMILLIGLSRLILNVHFLSDVLTGYIVGIFGLLFGVLVYTKINDKKSTK